MFTHPHDITHFTQGLLVHKGRLFESTGVYGRSAVMEVERHTGRVMRSFELPGEFFGEGLTRVGNTLVQITWREQTAWVYDLNLGPLRQLPYRGEGWGLSTWKSPQGERLVISDGSSTLKLLQPDTLAVLGSIEVRQNGRPVRLLNELETVEGEILANIWHEDRVVAVDPVSGEVRGWFDFRALRAQLRWPGAQPRETDLNGLAFDASSRRLLVTGKHWPQLFEVELGSCKIR